MRRTTTMRRRVRRDIASPTAVPTTPFTVQPQFGPLNVHSANVILGNRTTTTIVKDFGSTHLGPAPMPIFTPPPRTYPPYRPGYKKTKYGGPDFSTPRPRLRPPASNTRRAPVPGTGGKAAGTPLLSGAGVRATVAEESALDPVSGAASSDAVDDYDEDALPVDRDASASRESKDFEAHYDTAVQKETVSGAIPLSPQQRNLRPPSAGAKQRSPVPPAKRQPQAPGKQNSTGSLRAGHVSPLRRPATSEPGVNELICWETMIGQEIVKLVTMDLIFTIFSILVIDFLRGLWIKYCSSWWCWDIETTFPEYGEFKVAENVLHIINNQGMIWLGLFFAPLLPALNNVKLIIVLYIRAWACMSCNVPAREIFRASRSSNFYLWILLLWLMLCTLPVGLVIASKKPSRACGPFAHREWFYTVVTEEIEKRIDAGILGYARYVASPGIVIPIIIFLVLIIYFLVSLVRGLRDANTDLQQQLLHERTEEKKKIFELAGGGQKGKEKAEQRDREKRQMVQHLTEIEEKRREPWRQFNGGAQGASLLASDSSSSSSSSSCSSDAEDNAGAPDGVSRRVPKPSSTAETVAIAAHLRRSLGSLEEQLDEEMEAPAAPRLPSRPGAIGGREMVHSVSSNFPRSRGTRQSPSINSLDVHSNVVEMATPDEIRMISASASRNDLRASTHRALATTREEEASQRSSTETAGILKLATADFNMADQNEYAQVQPTRKKTPHSSAANTSKGFEATEVVPTFQAWPSLEEVEGPSGGGRKSLIRSPLAFFNRALAGKQPAQPPPPPPSSLPLSMSSGMPNGLPETSIGRRIPPAPTSAPPPVPPHHSTATAIAASASTSHSSSTEGASDTSRGITPARGRLPDNPSPQRRFRISVSPTRRMQPAASDDDSGNGSHRSSVGAGVRRYVVKQESAAPSQSSLVAPAPPATSPRAPIVNFDDDDSPRIDDATKKLLGMPPSSGK